MTPPERDWCATTFVVWRSRVLLHRHPKLAMWLPCGGHVDPGELPDDAAVREVREEAGVAIALLGEHAVSTAEPRQLVRPRGIQLEPIRPGHEHIDLIYFGRPLEPYGGELAGEGLDHAIGWFGPDELAELDLTSEVAAWCALALAEVAGVRVDPQR